MVTGTQDDRALLVFDDEESANEANVAIENAKLLRKAGELASKQGSGRYHLYLDVGDDGTVNLSIARA